MAKPESLVKFEPNCARFKIKQFNLILTTLAVSFILNRENYKGETPWNIYFSISPIFDVSTNLFLVLLSKVDVIVLLCFPFNFGSDFSVSFPTGLFLLIKAFLKLLRDNGWKKGSKLLMLRNIQLREHYQNTEFKMFSCLAGFLDCIEG